LSGLQQVEPEQLAAMIPNGSSLALAPDYSGCALTVVRALIRRGAPRAADGLPGRSANRHRLRA
jgi:hypothetical protein